MRAYLLLKVKPQETMHLMHDLQDEHRILEASVVHGPYDCVMVLQGRALDDLNDAVMAIRKRPCVVETMTSLIVQSWQRKAA